MCGLSYTCSMDLENTLYNIEMGYCDSTTIPDRHLVTLANRLLRSSIHCEYLSGIEWYKVSGICNWYKQEGYLSDKQHGYLIEKIRKNSGFLQFN